MQHNTSEQFPWLGKQFLTAINGSTLRCERGTHSRWRQWLQRNTARTKTSSCGASGKNRVGSSAALRREVLRGRRRGTHDSFCDVQWPCLRLISCKLDLISETIWQRHLQVDQVKAKLARIRRQIEADIASANAGTDTPTMLNGAAAEVELI